MTVQNNQPVMRQVAWDFFQRPIVLSILTLVVGWLGLNYSTPLIFLFAVLLIIDLWKFCDSKNIHCPGWGYLVLVGVTLGASFWIRSIVSEADTAKEERQRIATMFASDRDRPLTDIYVILTLDRIVKQSELANAGVLVKISSGLSSPAEKTVTFTAQSLSKKPVGYPSVTSGLQLLTFASPPLNKLEEMFVWDYSQGLNRIELGGYHLDGYSRVSGAPKTLGDLDKSLIQVSVTKPISRMVSKITVVANRYVVHEIGAEEIEWRRAALSDFDKEIIPQWDLSKCESLSSMHIVFNFSDLIPKLRPLEGEGGFATSAEYSEYRVIPGQHGWLIAEKDL